VAFGPLGRYELFLTLGAISHKSGIIYGYRTPLHEKPEQLTLQNTSLQALIACVFRGFSLTSSIRIAEAFDILSTFRSLYESSLPALLVTPEKQGWPSSELLALFSNGVWAYT
jgi:hypothetical protein